MNTMNLYVTSFFIVSIIASTVLLSQANAQIVEAQTNSEKANHFVETIAAGDEANQRPEVLIVGGGGSHNFERWFNLEDSKILAGAGANVRYTDKVEYIKELLPEIDILYLSNNQPLPDPKLRKAIFDFVESGNDLLFGHAATWYNWSDWPKYNKELVGGGSRGHDEFGSFEVQTVKPDHLIMDSVPATFKITDELYRFEKDENGSEIEVLAKGIEPRTGNEYPVVWTVEYGEGQIVCITLGHDDKAHKHPAYINILKNSLSWFQEN